MSKQYNTTQLQEMIAAHPPLHIPKSKLRTLPRFHAVPTNDGAHELTGMCPCQPLVINPMAWMHQRLTPVPRGRLEGYTLQLSNAKGGAL